MLQKVFNAINKYRISAVILVFALLITFTTSGIAAYKILKSSPEITSVNSIKKGIASEKSVLSGKNEGSPGISPTLTPVKSGSASLGLAQSTVKLSAKQLPTNTVPQKQISSPTVLSAASGNCVITLFGQKYDVTALRQTHSGGDVFKCGTDMTTIYQKKHGSNVSMMQPYLITGGGTLSVAKATQPPEQTRETKPTKPPEREEEDDD